MKYFLPLLVLVIVIVVWWCVPQIVANATGGNMEPTAENYQRWGQFGDMYGAINALFSGLTIAGLVLTIYLQQTELKEQRNQGIDQKELTEKQLELQRQELHEAQAAAKDQKEHAEKQLRLQDEELRSTQKQLKNQNSTLTFQRFETTFFNMLNLHIEIVDNLSGKRGIFANIHQTINLKLTQPQASTNKQELKIFFDQYLSQELNQVSQYIRNLECIIELVCETKKTDAGRTKFFKILAAQLTDDEREFLLYYFNLKYPMAFPAHFHHFKKPIFGDISVFHKHAPLLEGQKNTEY